MNNNEDSLEEVDSTSPSYFKGVFHFDATRYASEEKIRMQFKWFFDYLRNMMVVGTILFLGKVANNASLKIVGSIGLGMLFSYLYSYSESLHLTPFHHINNHKLAKRLNFIFNAVLFGGLGAALQFGLFAVVHQIADAYAVKH